MNTVNSGFTPDLKKRIRVRLSCRIAENTQTTESQTCAGFSMRESA
ncbi:MAG: hypothetical protein ACTTKX_03080 [Treponema sp.]